MEYRKKKLVIGARRESTAGEIYRCSCQNKISVPSSKNSAETGNWRSSSQGVFDYKPVHRYRVEIAEVREAHSSFLFYMHVFRTYFISITFFTSFIPAVPCRLGTPLLTIAAETRKTGQRISQQERWSREPSAVSRYSAHRPRRHRSRKLPKCVDLSWQQPPPSRFRTRAIINPPLSSPRRLFLRHPSRGHSPFTTNNCIPTST